jgi:hypothetical protein
MAIKIAHHKVALPSLVSVAKRRLFALGRKNLNGIGTWILL